MRQRQANVGIQIIDKARHTCCRLPRPEMNQRVDACAASFRSVRLQLEAQPIHHAGASQQAHERANSSRADNGITVLETEDEHISDSLTAETPKRLRGRTTNVTTRIFGQQHRECYHLSRAGTVRCRLTHSQVPVEKERPRRSLWEACHVPGDLEAHLAVIVFCHRSEHCTGPFAARATALTAATRT